jgi:hypothetical protein
MIKKKPALVMYLQHTAISNVLRGRVPMYVKIKPCTELLLNDNLFGDTTPIAPPTVPGVLDPSVADDYRLRVRCLETLVGGFDAAPLLLPRRFVDMSTVTFLDLSRNKLDFFPEPLINMMPRLHTLIFDGNRVATYAQIFVLAGLDGRLADDVRDVRRDSSKRRKQAAIRYVRKAMSALQRRLVVFSLAENPVATIAGGKDRYRRHMLLAFPYLRHLDHVTITAEDREETFSRDQIEMLSS